MQARPAHSSLCETISFVPRQALEVMLGCSLLSTWSSRGLRARLSAHCRIAVECWSDAQERTEAPFVIEATVHVWR